MKKIVIICKNQHEYEEVLGKIFDQDEDTEIFTTSQYLEVKDKPVKNKKKV